MENIKLNKKNFPNVIAAYGNLAGDVVYEMTRYVKGGSDKNNINSLLVILENNLKLEKDSEVRLPAF